VTISLSITVPSSTNDARHRLSLVLLHFSIFTWWYLHVSPCGYLITSYPWQFCPSITQVLFLNRYILLSNF